MIKNIINDKSYIGVTSENFRRRWWLHKWQLKNNCHENRYLQNAYKKYGIDNFKYIVLVICDNKDNLYELEKQYIEKYDTYNNGYNMTIGGEGAVGRILSQEAKNKIGAKNKINMLGKKMTESTKLKMSKSAKGHIKSKEHCDNLSKSLTGIKRSDETKEKLRLIFQGSKSAKAKLNDEQVVEIKKLLKDKQLTHQQIAEIFHVKIGTIRAIRYGKSWKHL